MRRLVAGALLAGLSVATSAWAQPQATDEELRAAYCLPVAEFFVEVARSAVAAPVLAAKAAHNRLALERWEADQRRLTLYLAPKMMDQAKIVALGLAMKSGEDDVAALQHNNDCLGLAGDAARECGDNALKASGLGERLGRCTDLSWLPL